MSEDNGEVDMCMVIQMKIDIKIMSLLFLMYTIIMVGNQAQQGINMYLVGGITDMIIDFMQ
jgi:hypothetical protein